MTGSCAAAATASTRSRSPPATWRRPSRPAPGMVCCSLRHAGEELLTQRDGLSRATPRRARRWACRCCTRGRTGSAEWGYEALGRQRGPAPARGRRGQGRRRDGAADPRRAARRRGGSWRPATPGSPPSSTPTWEPGFRAAFPFDHRIAAGGRARARRAADRHDGRPRSTRACRSRSASTRTSRCPAWHAPTTRSSSRRCGGSSSTRSKIPTGDAEPVAAYAGPLGERDLRRRLRRGRRRHGVRRRGRRAPDRAALRVRLPRSRRSSPRPART